MSQPLANPDPLLDRPSAAKYLGLQNHRTLANWDSIGRYPELQRVYVGRRVMYRQSALEAFLKLRTTTGQHRI